MKISLYCYLCQCMYEIEIGKTWLDVWLCPHGLNEQLKEVNSDGNDR